MGIKGLHGLLKSIQKPCHLKKLNGQTLGVDAYGWLHRGTVACAVDLVLDKPTSKHIEYVLNRIRMLLFFGVTPYLVFDGDNLPSKSGTEVDRHKRRQESKKLGLELQRKGRTADAYQELQKAVDVTPYMARQLIEELKKMDVQYVVAPYEADAQLVYLEREGIVNGIISEDSDMLVFGAKRLISKLDQHGDCIEINRADFTACREVSLIGWTDADFRRMCILSGCDYLPNIPRMGLKTAYRSIRKYKNVERALRMIQFEGQFHVPSDYFQNFKQAELTFLYQRVFDPNAGKLVTLTPPGSDIKLEELTYIGDDMDPEIAVGVARGDLDPTTKEPINLKPFPRTSLASGINRRTTLGSSAELKPKKPITTFFTPKRRPLAELDPNTLTPSPSQQQLLIRHANNSWEASPAPMQPRAVNSAPSNRVSSPLVRSAERTSFLAQASRLSNFQPSKRQRLCSETEDTLPDRSDCQSRFFSSAQDASPIGQKVTRAKKPRKSTLDVFSDEVAEDIMSQIPDQSKPSSDAGESETPVKCDEPNPATPATETSSRNTQRGTPNVSEDTDQTPLQTADNKSVSLESDPKVFHQVLDYHIEKQNCSLLSKYTFQPSESQVNSRNGGLESRTCQKQNTPSLKTMSSSPGLGWESSAKSQRLTPLQRLGRNALSRSQSLNVLNAKGLNGPTYGNDTQGDQDTDTGATQGSEDMLIPDSEEEEEPELEEKRGSDQQQTPSLDLKRFTFSS
ncbi:exonuclease [Aspergillus sclerotialis]|uniref:Exonuclease n=1 Tax=Aspergillus sclerotialis TaxID=2070753 RepID=A0A3A2ZWN6_9EURO|nr:exonuclease [Aspergillus sclerotialis]